MRTPDDLRRAAAGTGLVLEQLEQLDIEGEPTWVARWSFDDPWDAAVLLQERSDEDSTDPVVDQWSIAILRATVREMGRQMSGPTVTPDVHDAYARALHANVQSQIKFRRERGEKFLGARVTIARGVGDCDDHASLLYALAAAGDVPARLVFFECDEQPVHVVAQLKTSEGWQWAETTIPARFGEEPLSALMRLKVAGDPSADRLDIGTLFGLPTVAELRDFLAATQYTIAELTNAGTLCAGWLNQDRAGYEAWLDKLRDANVALADASILANVKLEGDTTHHPAPDWFPCVKEWNALVDVQKMATDLDRELRARAPAYGCPVPQYAEMPQPRAGTDYDLRAFILSGKALDRVSAGLAILESPWTWALVAAVAGGALAAKSLPRARTA